MKRAIGKNIPTQIVLPKLDGEGRIILELENLHSSCWKYSRLGEIIEREGEKEIDRVMQ